MKLKKMALVLLTILTKLNLMYSTSWANGLATQDIRNASLPSLNLVDGDLGPVTHDISVETGVVTNFEENETRSRTTLQGNYNIAYSTSSDTAFWRLNLLPQEATIEANADGVRYNVEGNRVTFFHETFDFTHINGRRKLSQNFRELARSRGQSEETRMRIQTNIMNFDYNISNMDYGSMEELKRVLGLSFINLAYQVAGRSRHLGEQNDIIFEFDFTPAKFELGRIEYNGREGNVVVSSELEMCLTMEMGRAGDLNICNEILLSLAWLINTYPGSTEQTAHIQNSLNFELGNIGNTPLYVGTEFEFNNFRETESNTLLESTFDRRFMLNLGVEL